MTVGTADKKGRAEFAFYVAVALLSIVAIVYTWRQQWAHTRTGDGLSMAAFPMAFAAALLVTAVVAALRRGRPAEPGPAEEDAPALMRSAAVLGGGSVLSAAGIWYFDAVLTSALLVLVLLVAGRVRDWRVLASISVGTGVVVYVLFILVLGVYFPRGWLR
jgi:hypothetical protein